MIKLHEHGIIEHLKVLHFRDLKESRCDSELLVGSSALAVTDVWPIFAIIGVGIPLAVLCLFIEYIAYGLIRRNTLKTNVDEGVHDTDPKVQDSCLSQIQQANIDSTTALVDTDGSISSTSAVYL